MTFAHEATRFVTLFKNNSADKLRFSYPAHPLRQTGRGPRNLRIASCPLVINDHLGPWRPADPDQLPPLREIS
jgi:hypothetical protein